ncbi:MAG: hypothetical protein PHC46_02355 [Clostridia bacterium]|nr:hypothetical protein [Clostridia bacterium]
MLEKMFEQDDNQTKQNELVKNKTNLDEQSLNIELSQAQNALDINSIVKIKQKLKKIEQNEHSLEQQKEEILNEKSTKKPATLEEARQNLEYQLLKNYLSNLDSEAKVNFLDSQINLDANLKQSLHKVFGISE